MSYNPHSVGGVLSAMLFERGLWPGDATNILAKIDPDSDLGKILNKSWQGYPKELHAIAWHTVKTIALEYIEKNMPDHFAKSLFEETP